MKLSNITLPLVLSGLLLQTGCLVGASRGNKPLMVIGSFVALGGAAATAYIPPVSLMFGIGGTILNSDDPGREIALNPIPLHAENAKNLGVTIEDIENYNYAELGLILETNHLIETAIADVADKKITTEEALNKLAPELGMDDSKKLMNVLKGDKLSANDLKAFADTRNISEASAKIYLQTRWSVKVN